VFESLLPLEIFPVNGLDRSLHAPVLVGLLVLTLCAELYGWTYAGLVVPGYLAAVFIAAPVTGVLVCFEALLTYWLCEVCGRWLPRFGFWSTTFGRERFFLFIVNAVLVRLTVEGLLVPWLARSYDFAHSRELYSLGLVLVPLVANALWNAGFWVSAPRVAAVTLVTYGTVAWVLLPYTNFTTSRFEIANESVSLAFLESPHAHIILLVGALLGARNNVRYGWDYNGILVPALLAVAWYQPTKLATTVIEALLVYWVSRAITSHGPLSRVLIVGSRRVVVTYLVGFAMKFALGFGLGYLDRSVQMVDYFGFGYLLPTLLAVKMWNKDKIGPVIMPTLQVSIVAFVVGNALGFALTTLDSRFAQAAPASGPVSWEASTLATELLLVDSAPAPRPSRDPLPRVQAALALGKAALAGTVDPELLRGAGQQGLRVARELRGGAEWISVGPRATDPNEDRVGPRFAVRRRDPRSSRWMLVVQAERVGSPTLVLGLELAEWLGAEALVVRSRLADVASYDETFARHLARALGTEQVVRLQVGAAAPRLSVVGALPGGFDVTALGDLLGEQVELSWRAAVGGEFAAYADGLLLEVPQETAARLGAEHLGAPEPEVWEGGVVAEVSRRGQELTLAGPQGYRAPSVEELRLFQNVLVRGAQQLLAGGAPTAWQRAVAARLGLRWARAQGSEAAPAEASTPVGGDDAGWVLFEPTGPERRGHATWVVRVPARSLREGQSSGAGGGDASDTDRAAGDTPLLIAAPAPRVATGTFAASAAMVAGLGADGWLLFGSVAADGTPLELARDQRVRSYYQQVQEGWLNGGGAVLAVRGISEEDELGAGALLSHGLETHRPEDAPHWTEPAQALLRESGVRLLLFDGSAATAAYKGSYDPLLAYAARFAPQRAALLWLSTDVRLRTKRVRQDAVTAERLERLGLRPVVVDLPSHAVALADCTAWPEQRAPEQQKAAPGEPSGASPAQQACAQALADDKAGCNAADLVLELEAYAREKNPFLLRSVLLGRPWCRPLLVQDATTGLVWGGASRSGLVWLVPLSGELEGSSPWLTNPEQVRRGTALGLATVRVAAEGLTPP
jgi:hypothetical protein